MICGSFYTCFQENAVQEQLRGFLFEASPSDLIQISHNVIVSLFSWRIWKFLRGWI